MKIGIDPGHGGKDSGAVGPSKVLEKNVNLALALLVERYLTESGLEVYLTRKKDISLGSTVKEDLWKRTSNLNAQKCDYSVSIHCDASEKPGPNHFGVYVIKTGGESEKLGNFISKSIAKDTGWGWGYDGNGNNDGVKEKNLALVRDTNMPSVLVECGFITNPQQEAMLNDPSFERLLARAIANGILEFLGMKSIIKEDIFTMEAWKKEIMDKAKAAGLIQDGHNPDDPASKWFVLITILRAIGKN
jgi:N-acetylmuramoyl-L-alanine amidase